MYNCSSSTLETLSDFVSQCGGYLVKILTYDVKSIYFMEIKREHTANVIQGVPKSFPVNILGAGFTNVFFGFSVWALLHELLMKKHELSRFFLLTMSSGLFFFYHASLPLILVRLIPVFSWWQVVTAIWLGAQTSHATRSWEHARVTRTWWAKHAIRAKWVSGVLVTPAANRAIVTVLAQPTPHATLSLDSASAKSASGVKTATAVFLIIMDSP